MDVKAHPTDNKNDEENKGEETMALYSDDLEALYPFEPKSNCSDRSLCDVSRHGAFHNGCPVSCLFDKSP